MKRFQKYFTLLKIVLLMVGCYPLANAQNQVPDEVEKNVLLSIYNSTNGSNWAASRRWTLSRINSYPDSALYGVSIINGDIQALQLISAGLNGTLPGDVNQLTALKTLEITSNFALTDTLPDLGGLTHLTSLNLSNNRFQGSIPEWITQLTGLRSLALNGNITMAGPIPQGINALTLLNSISLDGINLSAAGSVPATLLQLQALNSLSLVNCQLVPASLAAGLNGLNALSSLDLSSNTQFVMSDGTLPDQLLNLPALTTLYLQSNNLQRLPASFDLLPVLQTLYLSGNNFSDATRLSTIVDKLKGVHSLRTLYLISCQIDDLPVNFDELQEVESVFLNSNQLNPSSNAVLGDMMAMKHLYVTNNGMTTLPSELSNLTTLITLDASSNELNPVPQVVKNIPGLKTLILSNNGIEALPAWFGTENMTGLTTLTLNNNKITLPLPANFSLFTQLTSLNMASNELDGVLPEYFSGFTELNTINLSFNGIISPLPDFSGYHQLNYVYLQNNNLSGAVPSTLSNNTVPKIAVNLSFNRFDELTPFKSAFNLSVTVNNNRLDFSNILKVTRPVQQYIYIPQDTVISLMGQPTEVTAYIGDTLKLTAAIDRNTQPPSQYQWFKYVDGVNDIPLTGSSAGGFDFSKGGFSAGDEGKYYYKITNPAAPGLTLVSPIIIVKAAPCKTNAAMDITYTRYVCAYVFNAPPNSAQCKGIGFDWDFGDNKHSSDKNPVHGYLQGGTYTVSLKLTFKCGTACQADTVIQKQIIFDPGQVTDLFKDSVIQILTDKRDGILTTSAATFSDAWPLQHTNEQLSDENNFVTGASGVWRNDANYVYQVPRQFSDARDISKDGTFEIQSFNWQQSYLEAIPHWTRVASMTQYSPFSYELENKDALGIYSAALYDYGGHLPSANGMNMRNNEMAFTSFEYLDNAVSGNFVVGTQSLPAYTTFDVKYGYSNMAIVEGRQELFKDVEVVYVQGIRLGGNFLRSRFNIIRNDSVVCRQVYHKEHDWTALIVKDAPFSGVWTGKIMVKRLLHPVEVAHLDHRVVHSGQSSLHITSPQTFRQGLLHLDSAKTYEVSAWVSVDDVNSAVPKLADSLGLQVIIKTNKEVVHSTARIKPIGPVIEGWQQVKGTFTCPINDAQLEMTFLPGSKGQAWYDDLRLYPEEGNMKSYVYDLNDYRLVATLDEENFASFYHYDKEGNLYLVKKETEKGVKTISENINWIGNK